ncbi:hypothetical protein J8N05_45465 [Streptomyces sp. BH-SS-21]|uniref:Uncharacterized protein n=1 Tax=Streptomyces liliiviolaceus TaxID=2823109 RepID=A0A940Y158_9ACTN|nr:hypothetical protein [Streptomyces liliiviolaceus]MBQ0855424.1 hypothetical protein [Streptomyces liliiviolaceus]
MDGREPEQEPQTLAEKMEYLIDNAFAPGEAPWGDRASDRAVAAAINGFHRRTVVSHATMGKMRSGAIDGSTSGPYVPGQPIINAVAEFFDVDPLFFKPQHEVVKRVFESLNFLRAVHRGDVQGLAGRGVTSGLSADLLAYLNDVAAELSDDTPPS